MSLQPVIFGEVLFDCFPDGRRILGGAPFNVAWHLRGLGLDPLLVGSVGDDDAGQAIRQAMDSWKMDASQLQIHRALATGKVQVTLVDGEPEYEITKPSAWDEIDAPGSLGTGALLYHGTLALRSEKSRRTIKDLIKRHDSPRFLDLNLRPPHNDLNALKPFISKLDWMKLNLDELGVLFGLEEISLSQKRAFTQRLRKEFGIRNILLTAGKAGAWYDGESGQAEVSPAPTPDSLVDTVGAGDAFSAMAICGILEGWSVDRILNRASLFASRVCSMAGATCTDKGLYEGIID